jgi:hypothetical protein
MTEVMTNIHDFDFWLGEWDVFGPAGQQVGTNSITPLFEGHESGMLQEHWRGSGGVEGRSINGYDAARGCWHQTWMDSTGGVLHLDGGLQDGAMVLEGWGPGGTDLDVVDRQRITWTREGPDGTEVRQLWESSSDDGLTWTVAFDGRYRRRGSTT